MPELVVKLLVLAGIAVAVLVVSTRLGERRKGDGDEASTADSLCSGCGKPVPPGSPSCPLCGHRLAA